DHTLQDRLRRGQDVSPKVELRAIGGALQDRLRTVRGVSLSVWLQAIVAVQGRNDSPRALRPRWRHSTDDRLLDHNLGSLRWRPFRRTGFTWNSRVRHVLRVSPLRFGWPNLNSSFHEKLYNRGSGHTTPVAPAAPLRHRAFLATAPAAGAPLDAR